MQSRKIILSVATVAAAILLAVTPTSQLQAQTNGGSSYSIFNIGDLETGSTTSSAGRSGVEVAFPSSDLANSQNPAGWSDLRFVTIQAGLNFNQYQVSDGTTSISQNNSKLRNFTFAVPVSEGSGATIAFSLRPYSTVNYRTRQIRDVQSPDTTVRGLIDYSGRGGLSQGLIGASYRPFDELTLGATANLYFGSIDATSDITFPGTSLNPATYTTVDNYSGFGVTVGAHIDPLKGLRIGLVADLGSKLDRKRIASSAFSQGGRIFDDTTSTTTSTATIPPRITGGASYETGRFILGVEGSTQAWGKGDFPEARAMSRVALGVDRTPSTSVNATGFERWTFRFGGYYESNYYELGNRGITSFGGSVGARWPITAASALNSSTAIDFAIEVGQRGSIDNGLTREIYGKFYLGLSLNELWFVRRR